MYKGIAKSEKNTGKSITLPARVITPLDAYVLYSQGSPIDRMAGYYKKQGILDDDFFMMDQVGRLNALAQYRELTKQLKEDVDVLTVKKNEFENQQRQAAENAKYEAWKQKLQAEQQVTNIPV